MDPKQEARKEALRRRQRLRRHHRSRAEFTEENDHNPLVLAPCAGCGGRGQIGRSEAGCEVDDVCSRCEGTGAGDELAPYFDNNEPAMGAIVGERGWLTCPGCGARFTIRDPDRWTGLRHRTCGQKIAIEHASGGSTR